MSKVGAHYKVQEYMIICAVCKKPYLVYCSHGKTNTRKYCDDCIDEKNRVFNREQYRKRKKINLGM